MGEGMAAFNLGVLLQREGKITEAADAFRKGIELGNSAAAVGLGRLLTEQGRPSEAGTAYRNGAELGDGEAALNLGVLLQREGKTTEAVHAYRKASSSVTPGSLRTRRLWPRREGHRGRGCVPRASSWSTARPPSVSAGC